MPEFTVDVEFDVYCGKCGAALCRQSRTTDHQRGFNRGRFIEVDPCEKCMDAAKEDGCNEGYNEGYTDREAEEAQ